MSIENKNYSGAKPPLDEYDVNADGKPLTDGSAVKFIPQDNSATGKNGDAKVDIGSLPSQAPFAGMGKEELLKYANEPFWIRLRWFLFILFWLAWVAMFAGAIALIVLAPRCPPIPTLQWWQKSPIYRVEPRSFFDRDNDGVGDIKGIESKLDHFVKLGIKTVLIGSIYASDTFGDVLHYTDIDSRLGHLDDFKSLITEAHNKDIRIILDFIPNHSSTRHPWFNGEKKKKYYVWTKEPKNNWKTKANTSAWASSENNEYYYHKLNESQPDLNWRNEELKAEMNNILHFWLGLGADGFNMKDPQYLFENEELKNEAFPGEFTEDQPETFALIQEWKSILENYTDQRVLLLDVSGNIDHTVRYYGNSLMANGSQGGDLVVNYQLMNLNEGVTGYQISDVVNKTMQHVHFTEWPSWIISDTTQGHVATRFQKSDLVDCFNALLLMLKGTPITYYGDEIGLVDNPNSIAFGPPFTPMPWNSDDNGGFSNYSNFNDFISLSVDYKTVNVMAQETGPSHLKFYKELVKLRGDPSIAYGNMSIKLVNTQIFSFLREASGNNPKFLTILNLKNETYKITSDDVKQSGLPESGRLFQAGSTTPKLKRSTTITTIANYELPPYAALVFKI